MRNRWECNHEAVIGSTSKYGGAEMRNWSKTMLGNQSGGARERRKTMLKALEQKAKKAKREEAEKSNRLRQLLADRGIDMKYELIEHTGYDVSPARDIMYRIRYEDSSWLGKTRLVRTKKAAQTFHDINRARKGAIDMEGEWPSSELLKTWKIIAEKNTYAGSISD